MTRYEMNRDMAFAMAWVLGRKGRSVTLVRVETGDWRISYN